VSKRRAAVAAVTRMKQSSDYDEDSDDEPPVKRTNALKASPRGGGTPRGRRGRPKKQAVSDENDSEDEIEKASPRGAVASRGRGRPKQHATNNSDKGMEEGSEDEEIDEPVEKQRVTKGKQLCQYGKECYRYAIN